MPTAAELTSAIEALSAEFALDDINPTQINSGHCADFADALWRRIDIDLLGTDDIMEERTADLPPGIDWADLDRWSFTHVGHTWMLLDGKHYDAEAPEGIDQPFDIPCLRCGLHELIDLMEPGRTAKLEESHEWWRETASLRAEQEVLMTSSNMPAMAR